MALKKITDFEIVNKIMLFDKEIFRIMDMVDKKYRFNKVQQVKDAIGELEQMLIDSIDTVPATPELMEEKIFLLSRSRSRLRFVEIQLYRMNDDSSISNDTIARLIETLDALYGDYDRLLSSLKKKYESDIRGCVRDGELGMIRTANCGMEGSSNA